jgi:hypothetical protein
VKRAKDGIGILGLGAAACTVSLQEVPLFDSMEPLRSGEIDVMVCWLVLDDPGLTLGPKIAEYPRVLAVARCGRSPKPRSCTA